MISFIRLINAPLISTIFLNTPASSFSFAHLHPLPLSDTVVPPIVYSDLHTPVSNTIIIFLLKQHGTKFVSMTKTKFAIKEEKCSKSLVLEGEKFPLTSGLLHFLLIFQRVMNIINPHYNSHEQPLVTRVIFRIILEKFTNIVGQVFTNNLIHEPNKPPPTK